MSATDAIASFEDNSNGSLVIEDPSTIPRAIAGVIERLIGSNGGPLHVEVTVTRRSEEAARSRKWATMRIDDDGEGIPELASRRSRRASRRHSDTPKAWNSGVSSGR